jgi:hypothetical protein
LLEWLLGERHRRIPMRTILTLAVAALMTLTTTAANIAGTWKGSIDHISFEMNSEMGKLTFDGTVAGDEMKLTMVGPSGRRRSNEARERPGVAYSRSAFGSCCWR